MTQKVLIGITGAIALSALAFPAWAVLTFVPTFDVPAMQDLASNACKCERAAGRAPDKKCWKRFEALLPIDPDRTGGTFCAPLSEESYEIPGTNKYVILRYAIVGSKAPNLCSREEAVEGEAIWYRIDSQPAATDEARQINFQRANAALVRFADELAKGRPLAQLAAEKGCVTGTPEPY